MKQVADNRMRDVKAGIANEVARMLPKSERVASVKGLLQCDEDEARALISRGRRIAREKARESVKRVEHFLRVAGE
jgi:hypothetical protein